MPAYNVSRYIDEAIQSVLRQKGISFELLIGDDASTDGTWDRINRYVSRPQIRAWRFSRNRGAAVLKNYLASKAVGDYFSHCDADDIMLKDNLCTLTRVLDASPSIGVGYTNFLKGRSLRASRLLRRRSGPALNWDLVHGSIGSGGSLIRKRLFNKVGGYRNIKVLEDVDLFFRLSETTRFCHLDKIRPLYFYRTRPGSLSQKPSKIIVSAGRKILADAIQRRYGFRARWL